MIKKPEVWGGVLGALASGFALNYLIWKNEYRDNNTFQLSSSKADFFPLLAFPVGIGEEALFRGYLQPLFSEVLSPWGGLVASSLLFGAAHLGNTLMMDSHQQKVYIQYSIPFITFFGGYMGWLALRNQSLKESVAMHCWYDFALFSLSYSVAHTACTGKPQIAFSVSF